MDGYGLRDAGLSDWLGDRGVGLEWLRGRWGYRSAIHNSSANPMIGARGEDPVRVSGSCVKGSFKVMYVSPEPMA